MNELNRFRIQQCTMMLIVVVALFFTFQVGEANVLAIEKMVHEYCPGVNVSADLMGNVIVARNSSSVGIANPASQFCESNGGVVHLDTGICTFPDGHECDEWAYYRGEC